MRYDLVVVGHIVLDYISRKGATHGPTLGGPSVYASLAARALRSTVGVVGTVGPDFGHKRVSWLRAHGISVRNIRVANRHTTSFRLNYRNSLRSIKVTSVCNPINAEDVSRIPSSSAIHIGPVLQEIAPPLVERLAKRDAAVGLDLQGYLRRLAPDGSVRMKKWRDSGLLKEISLLKVSDDEFVAFRGRRESPRELSKVGPDIVVVTRGAEGSIIWSKDDGSYMVPAYRTRVEDPTGAGDAMAGAFLVTWNRTYDLVWSAAVGSAVASFVVEKLGPKSFGNSRQIEDRAQRILEHAVRL
jgi:sugar/nucleoside kinase (ribokinase family)